MDSAEADFRDSNRIDLVSGFVASKRKVLVKSADFRRLPDGRRELGIPLFNQAKRLIDGKSRQFYAWVWWAGNGQKRLD